MPIAQLGPIVFNSGWNPTQIKGPDKSSYIKEHQIPGAEGGIVEYLGSEQASYQIRGFLAPFSDTFNGASTFVLSGTSGVALNVDDSKGVLQNIRASGLPLVLRIESTWSQFSGYSVMFENDFFWIMKLMLALEAGRGYPRYPYTIDLKRASTHTYGSSSGSTVWNPGGLYMSGYIISWKLSGGLPQGETVAGVGLFVNSVASGNAKVAVYTNANALQAQSPAQAVHSGWNYFVLNPTFTTTSGTSYKLAMMGDQTSMSGFTLMGNEVSGQTGFFSYQSGVGYPSVFPDPYSPTTFALASGMQFREIMVTPG